MFNGALDNSARINDIGVQCPFKGILNPDNAILGVNVCHW